jgi:Cys-rich repeat protein
VTTEPKRSRRPESVLAVLVLPIAAALAACPGKPPCSKASDCPAKANQLASCSNGGCDYAPAKSCTTDADCSPGTSCQPDPSGSGLVCQPVPICQNDVGCSTAHVCRNAICTQVPCANAIECSFGEVCRNGFCDLSGCRMSSDCADGGVCEASSNQCVQCLSDADCSSGRTCRNGICATCSTNADCGGSQPYCKVTLGRCVDCISDADCAPGLNCSSTDNACHGVPPGGMCVQFPNIRSGCATNTDCTSPAYPSCVNGICGANLPCDVGGLCAGFSNGSYQCVEECSPYSPTCPTNQGCDLLSSGPDSVAFSFGTPLGGCVAQPAGAAGLNQACGAGCLYGLDCIPASAAGGICRRFCDLIAAADCDAGNCTRCNTDAGEACNAVFVGLNEGENIGVCYPPSDLYKICSSDKNCGPGFGCTVGKVPPGPPLDPEYDGYANRCGYAPGSKGGLTSCSGNNDCTSGICIMRGNPSTGMFCYGACGTNADCLGGVCEKWQFAIGAAPNQILFEVNGCRGNPCQSNLDCSAAPLTACNAEPDPQNEIGGIVMRCEPPAGTGLPGSTCAQNTDCGTDTCFSAAVDGGTAMVCWGPCVVGNPATCPAGTTCVANAIIFQAQNGVTFPEPACVP